VTGKKDLEATMSKILWLSLAALLAVTVLTLPALAQEIRMPTLVVPAEEKAEPLKLSAVKTEVRILGYLAETKMTMTFFNPNHRVLAGDLYFPLPEGATVSGYALDVAGAMVDGVVVEKQKGRQVYEKIVRQGIDPGLVEWVKGNNFKTRVFPILPRGSRTVMVRYLSELVHDPKGTSFRLPLNFKDPVDEFSIRVEVVKSSAKPVVTQGELADFNFDKWRDSYVASTTVRNQVLAKDLVIALPEVERQKVLVEKDADGEYYFVINDFPKSPKGLHAQPARKTLGRIVIFWDASGSRGKSDHKRELKLLETFLAKHKDTKVQVDLVLFRNEAEKPERFVIENGNSEKLIAALVAVQYDGGTQLGCLSPDAASEVPDFYLLFSDGLSNFGKEEPEGFKAPIYAISGDSTTNHSFLRYLSLQSGGAYFNINSLDDETILSRIGVPSYSFISAAAEGKGVDDTYPKISQPVYRRFSLVGKLKVDKAKITLNYGIQGKSLGTAEYEITQANATEGNLLRLFWAQKKVDELQVFPKRNEKEITATGKEYGLVTPGTSLIVLENLQQYVQHQIAPPKSLPDMRARYFTLIQDQQRKEQTRVASKLDQVVAMWQKRVDWWNTEFKFSEEFKYKAKEQKEMHRQGQLRTPDAALPAAGAPSAREDSSSPPARGLVQPESPSTRLEGHLGFRDVQGAAPGSPQEEPDLALPERTTEGRATDRVPRQVYPKMGQLQRTAKEAESGPPAKAEAEKEDSLASSKEGSISIKTWDPSTPYLSELKSAKPETYLKVYLEQRTKYSESPAFFLDCADFLFKQKQDKLAVRVLSNIAELELENPHLLRVLGHRLAQANLLEPARMVFEEVLRLRPEEPQSYRDLALVLDSLDQYGRAVDLFYQVVTAKWDRFPEIEVVALMEMNRTISRAKKAGVQDFPVDPRLIKLLDLDVRVVLTWDADMTDLDLWVTEPSGEKAFYQNRVTSIGGLVSRDITDGYGPEEYVLKKAMKGRYQVQANYYGSGAPSLTGAVTVQVDVFTNYGRPNEKRSSITLRLKQKREVVSVGEIEFQR
jgi:Ca-activated chloride channel homolog